MLITLLILLGTAGAAVAATQAGPSTPRVAAPSPSDLGDSPPATLSEAQADAIPVGAVSYPAAGQRTEAGTAARAGGGAHAAPGPACTLYANDPYLTAPRGRKAVEASGWQSCSQGINQHTQACLYKQHHFLFVSYFEKTHCGPVRTDRRATFRPVSTIKPCDPSGTGRWRTVIFGSIYYNGPDGPGRYSGDVRSENDKSFSRCN